MIASSNEHLLSIGIAFALQLCLRDYLVVILSEGEESLIILQRSRDRSQRCFASLNMTADRGMLPCRGLSLRSG